MNMDRRNSDRLLQEACYCSLDFQRSSVAERNSRRPLGIGVKLSSHDISIHSFANTLLCT